MLIRGLNGLRRTLSSLSVFEHKFKQTNTERPKAHTGARVWPMGFTRLHPSMQVGIFSERDLQDYSLCRESPLPHLAFKVLVIMR